MGVVDGRSFAWDRGRASTPRGTNRALYLFLPRSVEAPVQRDFEQLEWDDAVAAECRTLIDLALAEDLGERGDVTTAALVPADRRGVVHLAAREAGVAAGMGSLPLLLDPEISQVEVDVRVADGDRFAAGAVLAVLAGHVGELLSVERTMLNLIGRLCGIATLSRQYADRIRGSRAKVYDTRKTTPGWRRLEKYAVRCGGCHNHRTNLAAAFLIKDNHLAQFAGETPPPADAARQAVEAVRQFAAEQGLGELPVEVEVDSLEQLKAVLPSQPDLALLDNMTPQMLHSAAELRDRIAEAVELEASGGVRLEDLAAIAATGVDRISVGGLTHAARSLDVGLDWQTA